MTNTNLIARNSEKKTFERSMCVFCKPTKKKTQNKQNTRRMMVPEVGVKELVVQKKEERRRKRNNEKSKRTW